jgi:hypothetical protein
MDPPQNEPTIITRGRESPPLSPGPQRLHYQFSVSLPQTQLTFASVLQGVVFGWLLLNIPITSANISWASFFDLALKQYLYLPYIISSLVIMLIWIQIVHTSLFMNEPFSIFQYILVFLLTISEMLAFGQLKSSPLSPPPLSPWLFGLGWIGIVGGFIRIHNDRWLYRGTIKKPDTLFSKSLHGLLYILRNCLGRD